jgi:hypothetical protein
MLITSTVAHKEQLAVSVHMTALIFATDSSSATGATGPSDMSPSTLYDHDMLTVKQARLVLKICILIAVDGHTDADVKHDPKEIKISLDLGELLGLS